MFQRIIRHYQTPPLTKKLFHFSTLTAMIFLVDAILAYFIPSYIEGIFKSGLIMGVIVSSSSVIGLIADFLLPQWFPTLPERRSLRWATWAQLLFIGTLIISLAYPSIIIFIIAMGLWGIYYELLSFSTMNYVSTKIPHATHSSAWAHIDFGKNSAYIIGPLIVGLTLASGNLQVLLAALLVWFVGQLFLVSFPKNKKVEKEEKPRPLHIREEFYHWATLIKVAWPAITLHFVFGLIDASFWTIGTVLALKLAAVNNLLAFFLPLYIVPMIFSQLILMKKPVTLHKEKLAAFFVLIGAGILTLISTVPAGIMLLLIAVGTGFFISLSLPLTEAVYSNLEHRLGVHKQHLTGISSSVFSVAYIVGPLLAGYLSDIYHEQFTFTLVGVMGMLIALFVLLFSPKRMLLPQKEISKWKK